MRSEYSAVILALPGVLLSACEPEAQSEDAGANTVYRNGRLMLPGFQDSHIHPIGSGVEASVCHLNGLAGIAEYRSTILEAAFVNRLERDTGSIEVGKFADLVVLDQNLFEIEPEAISDTHALLTLFQGQPVHGSIGGL